MDQKGSFCRKASTTENHEKKCVRWPKGNRPFYNEYLPLLLIAHLSSMHVLSQLLCPHLDTIWSVFIILSYWHANKHMCIIQLWHCKSSACCAAIFNTISKFTLLPYFRDLLKIGTGAANNVDRRKAKGLHVEVVIVIARTASDLCCWMVNCPSTQVCTTELSVVHFFPL